MKKTTSDGQLPLFDDSFFDELTPQSAELPLSKYEQVVQCDDNQSSQPNAKVQKTNKVEDDFRLRKKRNRLKVSFEDGDIICDASATTTMIQAIKKIGVERVASLEMISCHIPLVSTKVNPQYAEWTKEIQPGWYLMAQSDTNQKYLQLMSIVKQLALNVKIELGDFETFQFISNQNGSTSKKKKTRLEVAFPNGSTICEYSPQHTLKEVVERIGTIKIKQTNLNISGKPIITSSQSFHSQVQLKSGEWLTIPAQTKDKYKVLRVISSMTHTPFDVKIIGADE